MIKGLQVRLLKSALAGFFVMTTLKMHALIQMQPPTASESMIKLLILAHKAEHTDNFT